MKNSYLNRRIFLAFTTLLFSAFTTFAQKVSISYMDPGPYTPNSTIAVLINTDNTSGSYNKNNVFNLYISDANGDFTNKKLVGSNNGNGINGSYATFINGTIPAGITNGTGYKLRVETTSPATVSTETATFYVLTNYSAGSTAGVTSSVLNSSYPEVFGNCSSSDNASYNFTNTSTAGSAVTLDFYNNLTGSKEATGLITGYYSFQAHQANYTVFVTAKNGNGVGTKAYTLINNKQRASFGAMSDGPICLQSTNTSATYFTDVTSADGLQNNYPGTLYTLSWGDGSTSDVYTLAQIMASGGKFIHKYTQSSAGQKQGSTPNAYQITFTASNAYCPSNVPIITYQSVFNGASNDFTNPGFACTNAAVTFVNKSKPPQSASGKAPDFYDPNATYSWYVSTDGTNFVLKGANKKVTDNFQYTFATHGVYTIKLHLDNPSSGCAPDDIIKTITVQDPPQPKFTLSSHTICAPDNITVTDNSVVDNVNNSQYTYTWTVTPATGVTYTSGNKNAKAPVFNFATAGTYHIQLQISANGNTCATATIGDDIVVNTVSKITMSPDFSICGKDQTLDFSEIASKTQTVITGSSATLPDTYTWTITPSNGAAPAEFVNGTSANSKYPSIKFSDYGTYTITITEKNTCGLPVTATQKISFQNAPTVSAGTDRSVCPGEPVQLQGTVSNTTNLNGTPTWTGGTAASFSDIHSFTPVYTPSADDLKAGSVTLTLTVPTTLVGACSIVTSSVKITFYPTNTITSASAKTMCTGNAMAYKITSTVPGSIYSWTASGSANAAGFTASGTGDINEAALKNTSPTNNATVTYTITPHANGCDGVPFQYTVTVTPQPVVSVNFPTSICSGKAAGIALSSNLSHTSYIWTATGSSANVKGFTSVSTPTTNNTITDVLVNTGVTEESVTYVVSAINTDSPDNCVGTPQTITIKVQPTASQANAGADVTVCNVATYQLNGNDLGTASQGIWTLQSGQQGITFDDATKHNAIAQGLQQGQTYIFRWTSKSILSCNDNYDEVAVKNEYGIIKADFTISKTTGCDPLTVTLSNISSNIPGLTYTWDFGNGNKSNVKDPSSLTYIGQTNGKDTVYTVRLTIANACSIDTKTATITVKPKDMLAQMAPDKTTGCIPFTVNLQNLTPGNNINYTYYLLDSKNAIVAQSTRTDKDSQPFTITKAGNYQVYMVAQGTCGTGTSQKYTIAVSPGNIVPRLTLDGNETMGCAPFTVTFHNNTTGGSNYRYEWNDGTDPLITTSTGDVTHTFAKGGKYNVVLHISNSCSPDIVADPVTVNVFYQPTPAFNADITTGCKNLTVHFNNKTNDVSTSEQTDLKYDWDFGDGTPHSSAVNPVHNFNYKNSPFTVTLTATNATGCSNVVVIKDMITVHNSSLTDFAVKPDSIISYPNYKFSFEDLTTGNPVTWKWDFGDGSTSTVRNPDHTYADTGLYKVTLYTSNIYCDSTKTHYVRITGVPGQLFVPNAFMPTSMNPDLKTFGAKGSGLKQWHMQIFNNYGEVVYETTQLTEKGEPVGTWDGTFKGAPAPQGVYIWQISASYINGNEWKGMSYNGSAPKRTGFIHLLR